MLRGFAGLIGMETAPGYRLGKEFAERVRFWTGLKGIFHTDELPAYNITEEEVSQLKKVFDANDDDAIVFVVASENQAYEAIKRVIERAVEAVDGVPSETRGSREDGVTFYMRPRPGMARMYPETDIPPIRITSGFLKEIAEKPIKDPSELIVEIVSTYSLNEELAWKLYDSEYLELFRKIASKTKTLQPTFLASFLADTLKYLEREGIDVSNIDEDLLTTVFNAVEEGVTEKEAIIDIIKYCIQNNASVDDAIRDLGLRKLSNLDDIKHIVAKILSTRDDLKELPRDILRKRLMAIIMSEFRGRVDPKEVLNVIDEIIGAE